MIPSKTSVLQCTSDFIQVLKKEKELWIIEEEVDPHLELAQIQREVVQRKGPALLFTNVKGTKFSVATNLYGSEKRLELAFGKDPAWFVERAATLAKNFLPPKINKLWEARTFFQKAIKIGIKYKRNAPVFQNQIHPVNLFELPQIKSWPEDGGAFITLPLVHTQHPVNQKSNVGMYRVQLHEKNITGMHIQIHRGGGNHYYQAEQNHAPLPINIYIGGPPALTIASIAPLPEDITEFLFASLLMGKKLNLSKFKDLSLPFVSEADFCIHGSIPPFKRRPEGPFGDHYGYYALEHDYPFVEVKHIFHRNDAIYPATIVGRPPQEDHYIAEFLQDLLSPLFPLVMPGVKQVWAYEESGVHSLAASVVNNRYPKEAFTHALRILGEGQLSLTKFLLVTDQPISLKDVKQTLMTILERTNFATDLFIFNHTSQDTLDYTGPEVNKGSKAILLGLGEKKRALKETWTGKFFSACFEFAQLFCPGILCVKAIPYVLDNDVMDKLKDEPDVQKYPLVVVLDDPQEACKSPESFIWHVFTRFEPASDLYGRSKINNMHLFIEGSLMIDCRFKPWYPKVLEEDTTIAKQVQEKWGNKLAKLE